MKKEKQLVILGAGGHGRVVADIAKLLGYKEILFLDDAEVSGLAGKTAEYVQYLNCADFFVAIGNSTVRRHFHNILLENGANLVSLVHPSAIVSDTVMIGKGTVVMAGVVVNANAKIGDGVIVNTCASVDHDCIIGDYVHVAVGAHICGTVEVGAHTWIGAGATVINNISICGNCMIGAGAVVVMDLASDGTYIGVPARRFK